MNTNHKEILCADARFLLDPRQNMSKGEQTKGQELVFSSRQTIGFHYIFGYPP